MKKISFLTLDSLTDAYKIGYYRNLGKLRETVEKFVQQNNNKNDSENKNICFFFIFFITV